MAINFNKLLTEELDYFSDIMSEMNNIKKMKKEFGLLNQETMGLSIEDYHDKARLTFEDEVDINQILFFINSLIERKETEIINRFTNHVQKL